MGKTTITTDPRPWRAILLIVITGLLSHGLVLFTDYALWDGIWINKHLNMAPRAFDVMERMWKESGQSYNLLWLAPMKGVANPAQWSKVLSVPAWIFSAVFFFLFLRGAGKFDPALSLMAALLAVCAPFVDLLGDLLPYLYVMPVCAFWAGMAAFGAFPKQETKLSCVLLRCLALALLFASFSLSSNLVLFCAVFGLYVAAHSSTSSLGAFLRGLWPQVKRYGDFVALPFVSWTIRRIYFPTYGSGEGYNAISLDAGKILEVYGAAFKALFGKFEMNFDLWWIWAFALVSGLTVAVVVMRKKSALGGVSGVREPLSLLVSGALLWLAAVFPYAVVGQYINSWGWPTRNAILFHVPLGLFTTGAITILTRFLLPNRPRAAWLPVAVVAGLGIGMSNASYLRFQAQGAKQVALAGALREQLANQNDVSLVQLRDYFALPSTFPFYPTFIWTYLAAPESEMPQTLVVDTGLYVPDQIETDGSGAQRRIIPEIDVTANDLEVLIASTNLPFVLESVPRQGRQFLVVISPGSLGADPVGLGARYLAIRYFQPEKMPEYLANLATIQSREIKSIQP